MADDLKSLSEIFNGNSLFRIPDYQRGYAWQGQQLLDFWDDIFNLEDNPDKYHYTGLLTLKELKSYEDKKSAVRESEYKYIEDKKVYHVLDGQQRLTTSLILIGELINYCEERDKKYLKEYDLSDIKKKYIYVPKRDSNEKTFIFDYSKNKSGSACLRHRIFKFKGDDKDTPNASEQIETYYTNNLVKAKNFFKKMLSELNEKEIEVVFKKLVYRLLFNCYYISDDYDVYVAFETMNNRGKPLSNLELLKNRLIYLTTFVEDFNADDLRTEINDAWKEVYIWLAKSDKFVLSDDDFLKAHWIAYYTAPNKKAKEDINFLLNNFSVKNIEGYSATLIDEKIYSITDTEVNDEYSDYDEDTSSNEQKTKIETKKINGHDISEYVNSLKQFAEFYYYTFCPQAESAKEKISSGEKHTIECLQHVGGMRFFRPLVAVALSKESCNNQKKLNLFQAIERFIFVRFILGSFRSDSGIKDYYEFAEKLNKLQDCTECENLIDKIADELNKTTDRDMEKSIKDLVDNVNDNFKSTGYYNVSKTRYKIMLKHILYEYEYYLKIKFSTPDALPAWDKIIVDSKDKISIEHILPQSIKDTAWENDFKNYNDNEIRILTGALGNLLLLPQPINSSLQNDSFADKVNPPEGKKHLRGYNKGTNSEHEVEDIAREGNNNNLKWTAKEIKLRSEKLIDFTIEHWKLTVDDKQRQELIHIDF